MPEQDDTPGTRTVHLTANEHDIVLRLLRHETAPAIAAATERSVHTVRTTIRNIYDKIGIRGLAELAGAVTRGELVLHRIDSAHRTSPLTSALRALDREVSEAVDDRLRSVRLRPDELRALHGAARLYNALADTQGDVSSLVDRIERLVAVSEAERSTLVRKLALLLGAQDAQNGVSRDPAQVDALATTCADTPFALPENARENVFDVFRTSYAAGYRCARESTR